MFASFYPNGEFTLTFGNPSADGVPMGLSMSENSHNELGDPEISRGGWTQDQFTPKAKRLVRNACYVMGDRTLLSFLTLTLPPLDEIEEMYVRSHNPELMRVFHQRLKRCLVSRGLPGEMVTVREFQKRGALHWHLVFQGRRRSAGWAITPTEITAMWTQVVSQFIGRALDGKASTKIERVRRDAGRYLSKYMTKNERTADDGTNAHSGLEPSPACVPVAGRSWAITLKLRRRIIIDKNARLGLVLWNHRESAPLLWFYEVEVDGKVVAIVGQLKGGLQALDQFDRSLTSHFKDISSTS